MNLVRVKRIVSYLVSCYVLSCLLIASPAFAQILAIVEFHTDVKADVQQAIATAEGVTFERPAALLPNHVIVNASMDQLKAIAEHDEVAYIFPADPALLTPPPPGFVPIQCAGMLTLSGPIGQYANVVTGWDLDSDHFAHLGYVFGNLTSKVPVSAVESEILRAMNAWSAVTNVVFHLATSPSAARTIFVEFASGTHGDSYPFDAAGAILAHTFYPVPLNSESIAGDVHLDASENWHVGGDIDIYTVVLHELGHAIGLTHTDNPGDVMYPYYQRGMQLSKNDIGAAQQLYGVPGGSSGSISRYDLASHGCPCELRIAVERDPESDPGPWAGSADGHRRNRVGWSAAGHATVSNRSWLQWESHRGNLGNVERCRRHAHHRH